MWKVIEKIRAGKIYTVVMMDEQTGEIKSKPVSIYMAGDEEVKKMKEEEKKNE